MYADEMAAVDAPCNFKDTHAPPSEPPKRNPFRSECFTPLLTNPAY